jgi:hypothetical protein
MSGAWTCGRCGVKATFQAGHAPASQPNGWSRSTGEWRCLGCRRLEAIEAAPSDGATPAVNRRRALTEFELLRDPSAPDRMIAKRVKCPTTLVKPVRAALLADGRLKPAEQHDDV